MNCPNCQTKINLLTVERDVATDAIICPNCRKGLRIKQQIKKPSVILIFVVAVFSLLEMASLLLKQFSPVTLLEIQRNSYFKTAALIVGLATFGFTIWLVIKSFRQGSLEIMPGEAKATIAAEIKGDGFEVKVPATMSLADKLHHPMTADLFGKFFSRIFIAMGIFAAVFIIEMIIRPGVFDPGVLAAPATLVGFFFIWGVIAYKFRNKKGSFIVGFLIALFVLIIVTVFAGKYNAQR